MKDSYDYRVRRLAGHDLHPETQMMGFGYSPHLSEGALKPPVFLTSTFVFKTAQEGKDFFDFTSGRRTPGPGEEAGLVYSRFNNPNLEVLEDRLCLWEEAEMAGVFSAAWAPYRRCSGRSSAPEASSCIRRRSMAARKR